MTEQHDNQSNTAPASTENSQTPPRVAPPVPPDAQNGSESPKQPGGSLPRRAESGTRGA